MKTRIAICLVLGLASSPLRAAPQAVVEGSASVDFGSYPANEAKSASFSIVNKGDAPLKISGARSSCDCVEAAFAQDSDLEGAKDGELPPGGKGVFRIKVLPDSLYEPYAKSVYVQTNDPERRLLVFSLSGSPEPLLKALPRSEVYAGHLKLGELWRQELKLEASAPDVELGALRVEAPFPMKAVAVKAGPRAFSLTLEATPPKDAPGRFLAKVSVPVSKPGGWKPLELNVAGFAGSELLASPAKVFVPAGETKGFEAEIELRVFSPEPLKLKSGALRLSAPSGVKAEAHEKGDSLLAVKLSFDAGALKSLAQGDALELSLPGAKPLSVPLIKRDGPR